MNPGKFFLGAALLWTGAALGQPPHRNLAGYLDQALHNSPLLKDYQNQVRLGQIDSARIHAGYLPQINGVSANLYAPTYKGWGYDEAITNGADISELVTFNQRLVSHQNLQTQYDEVRIRNESLGISGKISEQDLKRSVTAQYITAYGSWQEVRFNQEVQDLLVKEEALLKDLAGKGVYRETDYLTFRVTLQQQALAISQERLRFQNDFATLNYVCGIQDTAFADLDEPVLDSVTFPDAESTVFYRQFVLDSLQLRNTDALVDFGYKAKVSLYADAGYSSSFAVTPYKNFGASVGLNVIVPIYDGKQRKMQHDKVSLSEETRENYRDFFKAQYSQQLAQLFQQLRSTDALIGEAEEQVRYAEGLIDANRKLLLTGDAKIADYVIAIGNYLQARNVITQNTTNKLQIINRINYWNRK